MRMYLRISPYLYLMGLTLFMCFVFISCRKEKDKHPPIPNTPSTSDPAPGILSFTPSASPGGTIVIQGVHFSADQSKNTVTLNNLSLAVTAASATEITAVLPEEATTGKLSVTVNGKTVTTTTNLVVIPGAPVITSITPAGGIVGDIVTITGANFKAGANVFFEENQAAATVVVVSKTTITAKVPAGARSGKIRVTNAEAPLVTAFSPVNFYLPPTITSVSATRGLPGETRVEIEGSNFTPETKIYFGTTEALPSYRNDHFIQLTVPAGATTGKIKLVHNNMEAESPFVFTVMQPLSITSVTPDHGAVGELLTIKGANFQPGAQVFFEWGNILPQSIPATNVDVVSSTEITAKIPDDVSSGNRKLKVISGDRMGYYDMLFYSAPTITSIAPLQAGHYPGPSTKNNSITIYGSNFTSEPNDPSETMVQFGNITGDIVNISYSYIEVIPPAGLPATSPVSVIIKGMKATSSDDFTILPSVARHDAHGTIGAAYSIEGDFLPDAELYINSVKITDFIQKTPSKLYFNIPVGTTNGPVIIKQGGIGTKVFDFVL